MRLRDDERSSALVRVGWDEPANPTAFRYTIATRSSPYSIPNYIRYSTAPIGRSVTPMKSD